jgi:RNA polymerase primary sigma factor
MLMTTATKLEGTSSTSSLIELQMEFSLFTEGSVAPVASTRRGKREKVLADSDNDSPRDKDLSHSDAFGAFLAKIPNTPALSKAEETRLLEIYRGKLPGHEKALETLMMANQKLVVAMAKRYTRYGCPIEDLVSEGNMGLLEAIEKFDETKSNRIGTYASWWVRQYLRKALTENCRTIRIPICQQQAVRTIHATAAKLTELTGSTPTDEEIADEAGLEPSKVMRLRNLTMPMVSLQTPVGDRSGREMRTYEDIISDQTGAGESPLETLSRKNGGETLKILIGRRLNKKEQDVINLRFGLDIETSGGVGKTLEEVGRILGLTRERIRQIQDQALKKLKRTLMAEKDRQPTLLSILPADLG